MEGTSCKKIKKAKNEKDNTEDKKANEDCINAERYLTYDIVRIIFQYLTAQELANASIVCRLWLEAGTKERRRRSFKPVCLLEERQESFTNNFCRMKLLNDLVIKPSFGLYICDNYDEDEGVQTIRKRCPPNFHGVTLHTYGVVMNNTEIEDNLGFITCAFLPEIPDVIIKSFVFKGKENMDSNITELRQTLGTNHNGPCDKTRCLLLFSNSRDPLEISTIILNGAKWRYSGPPFPVWGTMGRNLSLFRSNENNKYEEFNLAGCIAVTIVGTKFDAWSIVIDKHCNNKTKITKKLCAFKKNVRLRKHSIGFMAACCARGTNMYKQDNVESSVFKFLFPKVQLVGCFGDGEFGDNTTPDESGKIKRTNWIHSVSTVFLIITYDDYH